MVVAVGYAQAWDLEAREAWRPMSAGEARERDATGLPYVVVYREPGREAPLEVRLVSWRDHYVGLWVYDAQGRRTYDLDMRLLDDPARLLRRYTVAWNYTGPVMAEFDPKCPRVIVDLFPDGRGRRTEEPRGYSTSPTHRDDEQWMVRPAFGEWPLLSAQVHGFTEPPVFEVAEVAEGGHGDAPATCWRPPRPAQPGPIGALFRPGVRVTDGYHPEQTVVEPRRVGTLRVPSGLLAVAGPDNVDEEPAITVPVPPGEYVLDEARVRFSYHCEWRDREVTTTGPTAVRLLVDETPAATWEMALGPDDDPRLFIEEQIAGFDTDGATGCFADAAAWEPLVALYERGLIQGEPDLDGYEDIDDGSMFMQRTWDEASGGELMAFATTGDGTYPVWIGRCDAGEVVAVVVLVEGMPELLPERDGTTADA
ncbi:DUF4241 domain-containing protein [Streptomyces sp. NBC_01294]|uniref:DUF4241 domain-containing protein n=1 Tax=Streptomyces sp. NBC_01294 TaxID=2903815 RepID=UPI002DDBE14E|nr:DUF4241 domain-containing protein [Streptomyces sp. NBC_01294]WRZ55257.1 DUF4241 domain-containing protein [Streptomyces sp. NBC_01294]WRZ61439.1 DUF4241 domain-containing protein [Streptomyces sp. NBC_01294]